MKVMCIDDSDKVLGCCHIYLRYGRVYEAIGEQTDAEGDECYIIAGMPPTVLNSGVFNSLALYLKSRFIPISDISETEMERNYNFKTEPV